MSNAFRFPDCLIYDVISGELMPLCFPSAGCEVKNYRLSGVSAVLNTSIWGRVLGSVQGGTNKCVRQGAKESGQIFTTYEKSELESLASRRKLSRICSLFKAYSGERAWKPTGDRLQRPHNLSSVDHEGKIWSRRQRTDIGKYSFVNRAIQHWNQFPAEVLRILPCKSITFKKRVRKVIIELN